MGCTPEPAIWSCDTGQRIPCFDSCQLTIIWNFNIKDNQGELHTCSMICNLHRINTFCTELPLFCTVLTKNCISFNQSEWRNFFMFIINIIRRSNRKVQNNNNILLGGSITKSGLHGGPNTRYI